LTILDQPITTWELALRPGQNPATLRPGYFFDVGVDAATIAVFDAVVLDAVIRLETAEPTSFEVWHADRPVERTVAPGVNAIAFETGWGDGATRCGSAAPATAAWAASSPTCLCSPRHRPGPLPRGHHGTAAHMRRTRAAPPEQH
jgi:hypothetical protein